MFISVISGYIVSFSFQPRQRRLAAPVFPVVQCVSVFLRDLSVSVVNRDSSHRLRMTEEGTGIKVNAFWEVNPEKRHKLSKLSPPGKRGSVTLAGDMRCFASLVWRIRRDRTDIGVTRSNG